MTYRAGEGDKRGVTAIELVVVVMVIAILVTIAIPRMSAARDRAFVATARADLRNLANLQEIYFSSYNTFTTDTTALGFTASEEVTVTVSDADGDSWTAAAVHSAVPNTTCEIDVNPVDETEDPDNQVVCAESSGSSNSNSGRGRGRGRGG